MELTEALTQRRTIRRFKQVQVLENKIRSLLDAARCASCGGNMQRLRYIVVQEAATVGKIFAETAWAGLVTPNRNPEPGKNAPLTFIAVTAVTEANATLHADAGAAIQNMQLAAWGLGIGCCWIGAYKAQPVREILELPEATTLLYLVAIGYPDEAPVSEDISIDGSPRYYLDQKDVLHVPKYTIDAITEWR